MSKGMNVQFNVVEVSDGLQKIEIKIDISRVPSSSTEAEDEIIDVTIGKHKGSTVDLEPMVRKIHGDLKSISSMAINVQDQEMLNVKLKVESDVSRTNPSTSPADNNLSNPEVLKNKVTSLVEEYFREKPLRKTLQSVEELRSPSSHPEIVREAMLLGLKMSQPLVYPIVRLIIYLLMKRVLSSKDVTSGCVSYALMLKDLVIDSPKAPDIFGSVIGKLIMVGVMNFKCVMKILLEVDDRSLRSDFHLSVIGAVRHYSVGGVRILDLYSRDVEACELIVLGS